MNIRKIDSLVTEKIVNMIVDDRLLMLREIIESSNLDHGDEFTIKDLFNKEEWEVIKLYPGIDKTSKIFKIKLSSTSIPVKLDSNGKLKDNLEVYMVYKYKMA